MHLCLSLDVPKVEDKELQAKEKPGIDGSAIWEEIKTEKRLMELKECLYKRIGTPSAPSGVVQLLFGIACVGIGALFLLFIFHTIGPGTFTSDVSQGTIMDALDNKTIVQCVCSAKPSQVITQLTIVMLVILSSGSAAFFIYFYNQMAQAVHVSTVVVDGCQEVLTEREHAINELIAGQKMDKIHMQYLEKIIQKDHPTKCTE